MSKSGLLNQTAGSQALVLERAADRPGLLGSDSGVRFTAGGNNLCELGRGGTHYELRRLIETLGLVCVLAHPGRGLVRCAQVSAQRCPVQRSVCVRRARIIGPEGLELTSGWRRKGWDFTVEIRMAGGRPNLQRRCVRAEAPGCSPACSTRDIAADLGDEVGAGCCTRLLGPKLGFIPSLCRGCRTKSEALERRAARSRNHRRLCSTTFRR